MTINIVDFRNVFLTKSNKKILDDISVGIKENSITGIIGKSGAGKTSLLRMINLLEKPSNGQVIIEGQDITNLDHNSLQLIRKKIGCVFQSLNLLQNKNVYNNIALPLIIHGYSKDEIHSKVLKALKLVNMEGKENEYIGNLSGGQKQRVAIARALVLDSKILLCDEITSALDPDTTIEILSLLQNLNKSLGVTIILITHDMAVIREICDNLIIVNEARVIEQGPIENIFFNPKHEVTKSFIHNMFLKEIPEVLKERFSIAPTANSEVVLRLIFPAQSANKAVISAAIKKFDIDINIISGHIDYIKKYSFGSLLISYLYNEKLHNELIDFLKENNVSAENIGYLIG